MPEPTLLLTGFEPFGGETLNPSQAIVQALDGEVIAGVRVAARVLPCCFGGAPGALAQALQELRPQAVLALGQAGGRPDLTLERVAINLADARIADNAGEQPVDAPVVPGGPAAYFSRLPVKAMVAGLRAAGWPASVSHTAGTFVCNQVFYALMHALRDQPAVRAGFMHVPWLPEQAARLPAPAPSMPLAAQVEAVRAALGVALAHQGPDHAAAEGRTH
ncbi:pyroglutamyl-peptidase I [Ideonella sp.]|uniref:pyroglutamyl-peptidase I n=1 Tax=Ideonella sp. TaxID=1929293 RepID=UPI0035B389A9